MDELEKLVIPLLAWYEENRRDLPWRLDRDPYHIWVSEIMLQQTRVAAVIGYYKTFLAQFPTISALSQANEDVLLKYWQGLGYYSRARNLQKAAKVIEKDYNGVFPAEYSAIRALPGIGDYTAGAIASIAFSLPKAAVDGNVLRVFSRITADFRDISQPQVKRSVAAALESVMPVKAPGTFNQALMELGATVCLPSGAPLCDRCPARDFCAARLTGRTDVLPVKTPKKPRRVEERTVWLLFHDGAAALRRRPEKGLLAGLWELPNSLAGEEPPLPLPPLEFAGAARHIFTHIEWRMTAWAGELPEDALPPGWVWATGAQLKETYSIPSAFAGFMDAVFQRLREKGDG